MAIRCENQDLPFTLFFEDVNKRRYPVTRCWTSVKDMDPNQLPILKENARINVCFFSETVREERVEPLLRIQTSRYLDVEEQEMFEIPLRSTMNEGISIFSNGKDEEFPWRMGVYFLEIHYDGRVYTSGFHVTPRHLNEYQIDYIHSYLNEQVDGIIYDFLYSKTSASTETEVGLPEYWYYDYARFLKDNYNEFMFSMNVISKKPKDSMATVYEPSIQFGRIDNKSIRWSMSNKGWAKNRGATQIYTYNKMKQPDLNIAANQWIKNILLLWQKDVSDVASLIQKDLERIEKNRSELKTEFIHYHEQKNMLSRRNNVGETMMRDVRSKLFMTEKGIEKATSQANVLGTWIQLLTKIENKMVYFLQHTHLVDVERTFRKPILKNYHYHAIDAMYYKLKKAKQNQGEKSQLTPILKPTWLLYEYFCLFKLLDMLRSFGCRLVSGLEQNVVNSYFDDRIPEGTMFVFEKEGKIIHVWYDHYHANTKEEAEAKGELFYMMHPKKKPDIKIDFFNVKESELKHTNTIVFDSKFSRFHDIYNTDYTSQTMEQLAGYHYFFYTKGQGRVVDKVICLYAGEDRQKVLLEKGPITYVNFFPFFDSQEETKTVGEDEIAQIFEKILID